MPKFQNSAVAQVFDGYPTAKRKQLLTLRKLIFEVAKDCSDIGVVEETLKWGEPAYLAAKGSTLRLGWQPKFEHQCGLYFNCQTVLVETFRELYADDLIFDGKRAVLFEDGDKIPQDIVKHCIAMSLRYHRIKHLPLLGA